MCFLLTYFVLNTILTLFMASKMRHNKISFIKKVDRLVDIFLFGVIFLIVLILSSEKKK